MIIYSNIPPRCHGTGWWDLVLTAPSPPLLLSCFLSLLYYCSLIICLFTGSLDGITGQPVTQNDVSIDSFSPIQKRGKAVPSSTLWREKQGTKEDPRMKDAKAKRRRGKINSANKNHSKSIPFLSRYPSTAACSFPDPPDPPQASSAPKVSIQAPHPP